MKVLIVGGGGREHALAWKLKQSPEVSGILCAPGNAGTARLGRNEPIGAEDLAALLTLAKSERPGLVVIGPEAPLALGLADRLAEAGIPAFGPNAAAAQIESSKSFSKELMKEAGIPTADFGVFDNAEKAKSFVRARGGAWAVKADGLAAGKGVLICPDVAHAEAAIAQVMEDRAFGDAGTLCVVEEFLEGEEASLLAFVDGERALRLPSAQDHKPIGEGDTGLNTGGMGAYSPAPVLTPALEKKAMREVIQPAVDTMKRRGTPYRGILYAGLMIKDGDIKVLEFNCRFGDPECQPLLMRMDGDLLPILMACAQGSLAHTQIDISPDAAVCVVMSAKGYPGDYPKGDRIHGLNAAGEMEGVVVFHAGTKLDEEGHTVTSGGRVLGVTARGADIKTAIRRAYAAAAKIHWEGAYLRRDIGAKAIGRT
ncbi:MAG: phosphoribosylamine--glycine ligase [bacterium]|nr:phosphoribosylamine--glycine ligase [bacterium]